MLWFILQIARPTSLPVPWEWLLRHWQHYPPWILWRLEWLSWWWLPAALPSALGLEPSRAFAWCRSSQTLSRNYVVPSISLSNKVYDHVRASTQVSKMLEYNCLCNHGSCEPRHTWGHPQAADLYEADARQSRSCWSRIGTWGSGLEMTLTLWWAFLLENGSSPWSSW